MAEYVLIVVIIDIDAEVPEGFGVGLFGPALERELDDREHVGDVGVVDGLARALRIKYPDSVSWGLANKL